MLRRKIMPPWKNRGLCLNVFKGFLGSLKNHRSVQKVCQPRLPRTGETVIIIVKKRQLMYLGALDLSGKLRTGVFPPTRGGGNENPRISPLQDPDPWGEKKVFFSPHLGGEKPAAGGKFWGFGPLKDSNPLTENVFWKLKTPKFSACGGLIVLPKIHFRSTNHLPNLKNFRLRRANVCIFILCNDTSVFLYWWNRLVTRSCVSKFVLCNGRGAFLYWWNRSNTLVRSKIRFMQ